MLALCLCACGDPATQEKTIIVGYTKYPPMNYMEDGKLVGFDTELAEKIFGDLGYKVIFKEIQWEDKYTNLNSMDIDCIWNGFTCNTADSDDGVQRSEKVDFSYRYMQNRQVVVVKTGTGINTAADLAGKQAAVEAGSAGETYANGITGATVKSFGTQMECLMDVNAGTSGFAVADALLVESVVGKGDYANLTILEEASATEVEYYAIGFRRGSDLTAKVNTELEKLAASGYLLQLAQKYKVDATVVTDFADQK